MAIPDLDIDGSDSQDQAEIYDESHNTDELDYPDETRSFEPDLFDDVYDATAKDGDADEDDIALDAADYDPDDLSDSDTDEDKDSALFLDDDLEDEDDDLEQDDFQLEEDAIHAASGEADVQTVSSLDDSSRTGDRLARRYESNGELSDADVRELGYATDKENTMDNNNKAKPDDKDAKGSGASPEDVVDESHPHQEELLDEGVEETFPASDPVSVKHIT